MAQQLEHVGEVVGRRGKDAHARALRAVGRRLGDMEGSVNTLIDDLLWPTTAVTRT